MLELLLYFVPHTVFACGATIMPHAALDACYVSNILYTVINHKNMDFPNLYPWC